MRSLLDSDLTERGDLDFFFCQRSSFLALSSLANQHFDFRLAALGVVVAFSWLNWGRSVAVTFHVRRGKSSRIDCIECRAPIFAALFIVLTEISGGR